MQQFIPRTQSFNLSQTLNCGQVFRFKEEGSVTTLFSTDKRAIFTEKSDGYLMETDDPAYFERYLALDTDYNQIKAECAVRMPLIDQLDFGGGIHILNQDPLETIISFLITQNNNLPRIKCIIERLCTRLGRDMGGYYAFPTLEALASEGADFYASIGAGYRAEYLSASARRLLTADLGAWKSLPTNELRETLMSLHGVGRKVADCVLLFGFGRTDVFPVDTWIMKVFGADYPHLTPEKLSQKLVEKYGDLSGYIQQYMFYYKRENS
jgi:N-glycosylase/DNA lyase